MLRTEHPFVLPKGFVDADGRLHREGTMRLATARDELDPLSHPRVKDADDPYLTIVVLSRVVTRLGTLDQLAPKDVEGMFAADLAHLQDVYAAINYGSEDEIARLTAAPAAPDAPAPLSVVTDATGAAGDDDPAPAPERPRPTGRRARIEEVGRSSGGDGGR